jgi:spermidine synthase
VSRRQQSSFSPHAPKEVMMSTTVSNEARFIKQGATLLGILTLSLSLLLTEILLTRVFSVLFMYHFAFLVISAALFGLGVGGIAVYLYPERFGGDLQSRLVSLTLCFAAALVMLVLFLFNLPLVPSTSIQGTVVLVVVFVASALPFFVGGACLALLLSRAGQDVNRLYFFDLLGAGIGCLLIIPALNHLGGVTSLLCASAGAALSALCFSLPSRQPFATDQDSCRLLRRTLVVLAFGLGLGALLTIIAEPLVLWFGKRLLAAHPVYSQRKQPFSYYFETWIGPEIRSLSSVWRWPLAVGACLAAGGVWAVRRVGAGSTFGARLARHELRLAAGATLAVLVVVAALNAGTDAIRVRFAKGRVEFQNLYEGWNSFSRVVVSPRNAKNAYAWGLSPLYTGPPGQQLALDIDSLAGTPLVKFDGNLNSPAIEHLAYDITALAYPMRHPQTALVIGPGGGRDVLTALKYGARDIDAVEINPLMREVVDERFGNFTGRLYQRPEVHLTIDDGRHFVRRSARRYDLIQLSLVDTWASTAAGAFALSENTLYTVEAFRDYLQHLAPHGVLTISRWLGEEPRETLRVVSVARAALASLGITDVSRHILVAGTPPLERSHRFASVIVSRDPLSQEEIDQARIFVASRGFEVLYFPGEPRHPVFSELILTKQPDDFLSRYEHDVTPTTDDRPFFFNTVWPRDFLRFWDVKHGRVAVHLLGRLLLFIIALVAVFMIAPLVLRRRGALAALDPKARWSTLVYFGALGAGFMLVEVTLISKFILFLGHPTYALTVVLCTLLISAGLGSYWSGRNLDYRHATLGHVIAATIAAIILLTVALDVVLIRTVGTSLPVCVLLSIVTLAPVAFLMGMPFPLGLRLLGLAGPQWAQIIPWVWGVNGATSVLGSILAIAIAINIGFRVTLVVGLCIYALAWVMSRFLAGGPGAGSSPRRMGAP